MAVDKIVAAKVAAYWDSWSPAEFAGCAENGTVYQPRKEAAYFAIGRGDFRRSDRPFPIDQLSNPKLTPNLAVVLPVNAINSRTLAMLWIIEAARAEEGATGPEIEIIGEVDKDPKTRNRQYALETYHSLKALTCEVPHGFDVHAGPKVNKKNIVYLREILALKLKAKGQFVRFSSEKLK